MVIVQVEYARKYVKNTLKRVKGENHAIGRKQPILNTKVKHNFKTFMQKKTLNMWENI